MHYISDPENLERAQKATVLASIDGLYWPTIYAEDCSRTASAITGITQVIQFANDNRIPILLGNVPDEDESKVDPILKANGWSPPKPECVKMVNDFLAAHCLTQDQCYVIDLHQMVASLRGIGSNDKDPGIVFEHKKYRYQDFRADGVHIYNRLPEIKKEDGTTIPNPNINPLPDGMRYVKSMIKTLLIDHPPVCPKP